MKGIDNHQSGCAGGKKKRNEEQEEEDAEERKLDALDIKNLALKTLQDIEKRLKVTEKDRQMKERREREECGKDK